MKAKRIPRFIADMYEAAYRDLHAVSKSLIWDNSPVLNSYCGFCGRYGQDCTCPPSKDLEETPKEFELEFDIKDTTLAPEKTKKAKEITEVPPVVMSGTSEPKECYLCKKPTNRQIHSTKMPICLGCAIQHLGTST